VPGATWRNGVIEINSTGLNQKDLIARDAVIRARATKLPGQNISLGLRRRENGAIAAWFNGGRWFGISRNVNGRWSDVKHGNSKRNIEGEFEFKFSVIGDKLSVWANGELVLEARDSTQRDGWPSIGVTKGRGRFRNVEVQVLDTPANSPLPGTP
jgi:hypothetical protein